MPQQMRFGLAAFALSCAMGLASPDTSCPAAVAGRAGHTG